MTERAEGYLQELRGVEAQMGIETALRLNPGNTRALRLLAGIQEAQGQGAEAMKTWQELVEHGGLSIADVPEYARLAAKLQDWAIADRLVDSISAGKPSSTPHVLKAELQVIRGDLDGAERSLMKAVSVDSGPEERAVLARFLLLYRKTPDYAQMKYDLLKGLSTESTEIGALSLTSALENNLVPEAEMNSWIERLNRHSKATPAMLLVADSARVRVDPDYTPLVAARVFARLGKEPLDSRKDGMLWLLAANEPGLAARLVTKDEALGDPAIFVKWLDALTASGRRWEVLEVLSDKRNLLPDIQTRLYQANTLKLLGRWQESHDFYKRVLEWSFDKPQARIKAMTYVYLAGENRLFEWSLRPLLKSPGPARAALRAFLPVAQSLRDIHQTRRLHELALEEGGLPQLHHLRNECDYSDLILGKEVDPELIGLLASLNPDDLALRLTWALSQLRDWDGIRAAAELEDCERIPNSDPVLAARFAMLKAAAQAANGQRAEALKIRGNPKLDLLTHQENAFLRQVLLFPLSREVSVGFPKTGGAE
ncbi:MAG: hypothetical protein KGR46_04675 [Verrucomicrobia bacterium]|nr:hypothetical protein [Verrucomicrobiota bacterium]